MTPAAAPDSDIADSVFHNCPLCCATEQDRLGVFLNNYLRMSRVNPETLHTEVEVRTVHGAPSKVSYEDLAEKACECYGRLPVAIVLEMTRSQQRLTEKGIKYRS